MPVDRSTLLPLASQYTADMTSIRGRRVQRLLLREFADAEQVLQVRDGAGRPAVLALWTTGAAFCGTDGRGPYAAVIRWDHGAAHAVETRFDLRKDSLPVLDVLDVPPVHADRMQRDTLQ